MDQKPLIREYGKRWLRNNSNLDAIPKKNGIYVLYDGSTPVYVGRGILKSRIDAATSERRTESWDHFSWYVLRSPKYQHDVEALLINQIPWHQQGLNRQGAKLLGNKIPQEEKTKIRLIKHRAPKKRKRSK